MPDKPGADAKDDGCVDGADCRADGPGAGIKKAVPDETGGLPEEPGADARDDGNDNADCLAEGIKDSLHEN